MTVSSSTLVSYLNLNFLEKVWNSPRFYCFENIRLNPFVVGTSNILMNLISDTYETIALPNNEIQYSVFTTDYFSIQTLLLLDTDAWYQASSLIDEYSELITVYTENGFMVPKSSIYLRYSSTTEKLYIAIDKLALYKVDGVNYKSCYLDVLRFAPSMTKSNKVLLNYYSDIIIKSTFTNQLATITTLLTNLNNNYYDQTTFIING